MSPIGAAIRGQEHGATDCRAGNMKARRHIDDDHDCTVPGAFQGLVVLALSSF